MASVSSQPLSPSLITKFTNVTFLRNHVLVKDDLWVRDGAIIDPQSRFWEAASLNRFAADVIVDCDGLILAPGYIDLQLNGAFGIDFSNPDDMAREGNIEKMCTGVLQHGVTSIYATIITSAPATYAKLRPLVKCREGSAKRGAHILGLHLEGPFITVPGAHPVPLIRGGKKEGEAINSPVSPASPSTGNGGIRGLDEVHEVYGSDLTGVGIITLAPEIEGVKEVIETLSAPPHNIVISAGHSKASFPDAMQAFQGGCRLITHLFNAMVSFHHRDPGLVGLIGAKEVALGRTKDVQQSEARLTTAEREGRKGNESRGSHMKVPSEFDLSSLNSPAPPSLFYSIIVDGHHTHQASVKIAYSTHPRGAVLVTDAMCAMGLSDGSYKFGEISVDIKDDMAKVAGTNTLAGSIATMEKCVQNFHAFTQCSIEEALEAASLHPAQCMRLPNKGALDIGMDADLILVDRELNVKGCWVMGQLAWKKENIKISYANPQQQQ